uniref:Sodefrin-like factor n=1 Tax=Acrobeloides nanus TaxID=290746 RepID=A0A914ER87_9BILA
MAFKEIIILLVALFSVGIAIECPTCQADYCNDGGISEPCPDDIHLCYLFELDAFFKVAKLSCDKIPAHNAKNATATLATGHQINLGSPSTLPTHWLL